MPKFDAWNRAWHAATMVSRALAFADDHEDFVLAAKLAEVHEHIIARYLGAPDEES